MGRVEKAPRIRRIFEIQQTKHETTLPDFALKIRSIRQIRGAYLFDLIGIPGVMHGS